MLDVWWQAHSLEASRSRAGTTPVLQGPFSVSCSRGSAAAARPRSTRDLSGPAGSRPSGCRWQGDVSWCPGHQCDPSLRSSLYGLWSLLRGLFNWTAFLDRRPWGQGAVTLPSCTDAAAVVVWWESQLDRATSSLVGWGLCKASVWWQPLGFCGQPLSLGVTLWGTEKAGVRAWSHTVAHRH